MISRRDQFRKYFKRAQLLLLKDVINEVDKKLRKKERIWVRNWINETDQKGGDAIPAKIKLEVTLSFLSTGDSYRSLSHMFRLPKPTISKIIPEVCQEIKRALKDHVKIPTTQQWKQVEEGFRKKWNFPLCYGALDGKHIKITGSYEYGSSNFNYKNENSIVLMALVDHDYSFTYINVGANGSASDDGIFKNCSIYSELENGSFIPQDGVIVADEAFPLKTYLMKPYPGASLSFEQKYIITGCRVLDTLSKTLLEF
ncbi:unnamed protein product [Euphydryas editha]|uniref:DDE Tnp4 domain-containing protein n=1 Tax=Euphydryas editha TaxID=104508 RepID=A0AAU9TDM3_EUPED|nr:unnamed protein product [Euphydryas editha]